MFSEYEDYLNQDFSTNFWSDEGIDASCEILSKFSAEDWIALASKWREKTNNWKVRCAETIDSYPSHLVMDILLDMLGEDNADVIIAAADSLRSLTQAELRIPETTLERIVILRDRSGVAVKRVLSDFIERATA